MKRNLSHYFIPHPQTHQKAHLLSWRFFLIYILLFVLLRTVIDVVSVFRPGILGVSSDITVSQIIEGTNKERQKAGLPLLVENQALNEAARAKAQNMFAENYWAHFSPSGKDPWGFILTSGYKFSYAGENLARNFYNSNDAITAWMNSPSHRENILNSKYQDIGIAVVDGVLNGQKTTLVVQMFGRSYGPATEAPEVSLGGNKINVKLEEVKAEVPTFVAGTVAQNIKPPLIDPYVITKTGGLGIVLLVAFLLLLDFVILRRRGVFRFSSHHIAHLGLLTLGGASVILSRVGEIL